jgi:DNA-binding response OmpR family regulator
MAKDTILIADDDRVLVTGVAEFLRKKGFNVVPAFDSMQAMLAARQSPIKAIILDINMPGGTGLHVLEKLKAMTKTSQIPVLVQSASLDPAMAEQVKGLGADEFLKKPVDYGQLYAALLRVLGRPPEDGAA